MIDRYTWDEADLKVKSLTYLSLGTEATRIFYQRNPHTIIDRCSTNELVYELGLTFTRPRNLTFDRFQLITVQQLPNESLETFFSRLRELGSKAALGNVEEDLIKDFFIAKMNNTTIQMELLSEVRTAAQLLNFALSRERGQENQKEILRSSAPNWNNQVNAITNKYARSTPRPQQQNPQQSNKTNEQCWRCGGNFTAGHMNQCTAKKAICNICKKTGHFAKMCRSKIPPLPAQRHNQRSPAQRPQGQISQLKVRQIQEQLIDEDEEEEQEVVSVDPESALYIKELSEDWADINHIAPESFSKVQNVQLNTTMPKEIWVETTTKNLKIQWLADTGSPRSFVTLDQANKIMEHIPEVKLQQYTSQTKYKCFNNNNIKIEGELIINLQSGSWTAQNCQILVVGHKTHNLMGRDVLQKLGISLQQKPKNSPDQATLRHPALPREILWDWDHDSETELDIQYKTQPQPTPAASDTDDSENAPLLSHKRVPEEKAAIAKQQEAQARSSHSTPLQPTPILHNQPGSSKSIINTQPLGHSELIAMAKKNQQAQKRKLTTKRTLNKQEKPARSQQRTDKSPGNTKRPQWLKNAKARLTKQPNSSTFDQKSKAAALQQTKLQAERKLLYSSSSDSKSFTSINKAKQKFSPTVKIHSIQPESPGTTPFEIVTSSDPNDFMIDNNEPTQDTSGSASPLVTKRVQGIMKSTPRLDKIVNDIWSQPSHERITIDNSSADDFPIQPPIRKIEVVYLDTTTSENTTNADVPVAIPVEETTAQHLDIPVVELSEDTPPIENNELPRDEPIENNEPPRNVAPKNPEQQPPTHEEEHKTPTTSPGRSSISSIHMSDFFNQDEF